MLDRHIFSLMPDMKNSDAQMLVTEGVCMLVGRGLLATIYSSRVNLIVIVKRILE